MNPELLKSILFPCRWRYDGLFAVFYPTRLHRRRKEDISQELEACRRVFRARRSSCGSRTREMEIEVF